MEDKIKCPYNDAAGCFPSKKHCDSCGWNPDVSKARLEKFCKEHHITVPRSDPEPEPEEE